MVNILVVEDDITQLSILTLLLKKHGYAFSTARDGQEAFDAIQEEQPDLVISDINMPIMDGLTLCSHIKSDADLRDLPVLLVTATEDANDILRALDAFADGYLTKPFNEEILIATVRRLLDVGSDRSVESFEREDPVFLSVEGEEHALTAGRRKAIDMLLFAYQNSAMQTVALAKAQQEQEKLNRKLTLTLDNLAASEERYRGLVQTIPDIVYKIDREGNFTFINDAIHRLGYHQSDLLGKHFSTILYDEDIGGVSANNILPEMRDRGPAHPPKLFDERRTGERMTAGLEIRLKTERGDPTEPAEIRTIGSEVIHVEVNSMGMYGVEQDKIRQYIGTVGVIRDISERHAAAEVARVAKEQAIAANKAKTEFLSGMSHELRTPLNAILGFGQILDSPENPLDEDQLDSVGHILDSGRHLLKLINEVLDLARIESGQLSLSLEPVEAASVIRQCIDMTRNMREASGISLTNNVLDTGELLFIADITRFKQAYLNLLSNAVKYNRKGGSVSLDCEPTENGLRFSISDTGNGIAKDRHHEIFTPFRRLGAEKGDVDGTGIGLTITRELIEMMNGQIGFESEENVGSTFWFELPATSEEASANPEAEQEANRIPDINAVLKSFSDEKTILYVEDNPSNVELMTRIIDRTPNVNLIVAYSAQEGIERAAQEQPHLILMDLDLPDMSGIDAKYALAGNPDTRNIPVIAVSANVMEEEVQRAIDSGMTEFIKKPLDVEETWRTILEVFATSSG